MESNVQDDSVDIMLLRWKGGVNLAAGARTRTLSGLSTARFAGMSAAGRGWEAKPVRQQQPQFAADRHRLAEVIPERGRRGAAQ